MNRKLWEVKSAKVQKKIEALLKKEGMAIIVEVHEMPDGKKIAGIQLVPVDMKDMFKPEEADKIHEEEKSSSAPSGAEGKNGSSIVEPGQAGAPTDEVGAPKVS